MSVVLVTSFLFFIFQIVALRLILVAQRRPPARGVPAEPPPQPPAGPGSLNPEALLGWEFEYARTTASEAMQDRHTMVNFYLLAVGIVVSAVVTYIAQNRALPGAAGTLLLWLLCLVGWFYFLKLIRFRQAWHESVRAMNQIKAYYVEHARSPGGAPLQRAFLWGGASLPRPEAPWTIFYYSAMLVAFLNSVAFVAGGIMLAFDAVARQPFPRLPALLLMGLGLFLFHAWLYWAMLGGATAGRTGTLPAPAAPDDVEAPLAAEQ